MAQWCTHLAEDLSSVPSSPVELMTPCNFSSGNLTPFFWAQRTSRPHKHSSVYSYKNNSLTGTGDECL